MPLSPEAGPPLLDGMGPALSVETILQRSAHDQAITVESFRPLGSGLDWELGQLFFKHRGKSVFLNGEVPYLVNNDGVLAARAAAVFFTSLEERADSGELPGELRVLEFGGGSCLFARGFLLAFERISSENGRDYHRRLTYVLADHSDSMLQDARSSGVVPPQCRVLFARADAVEQQFDWLSEGLESPLRFDAIFLNYLLDCLPASVLRTNGSAVEQLCVQTELSMKSPLLADMQGRWERIEAFASGADRDRSELIDLYPLFRLRCRYQPAIEQEIPFFQTIAPHLKADEAVLHSYGAVACLEACLGKLRIGGFVLFSDYEAGSSDGAGQPQNVTRLFHQHFGSSTAIGLNLKQLKDFICGIGDAVWAEPLTEDDSLVVRLAGAGTGNRATAHFRELFDRRELDRSRASRQEARKHRSTGAHLLALHCYREAIRLQPENWDLIGEAALFCESALNQHETALDLARVALDLNPIDPDLWNTLGDSLYSLGRTDEADRAFRWALELSPTSVRARYNLVYTLTHRGDFEGALAMIAEALAGDSTDEYADRLLKRQREILNALKQRRQRIVEGMADRYVWE